jgi:hypothetical protein
MARDLFGIALFIVIYVTVFMAVFGIVMAAGDSSGQSRALERIAAVVVAILSFPLISPFLYIGALSSAIVDVGTVLRLAILNGLFWGFLLASVRRKLLKRSGRTRLF